MRFSPVFLYTAALAGSVAALPNGDARKPCSRQVTKTVTHTPTKTVRSTVQVTRTATASPSGTATVTTTVGSSSVVTVQTDTTTTVTSTTTSTSTSTYVSPAPNFTGVQESLPGSSYSGSGGGSPIIAKRDALDRRACKSVHTSTVTAPAATVTKTVTNHNVVHTTPPATSTTVTTLNVTTSTVTSFSSTATNTATQTSTEVSTTTLYAACAETNFADMVNGQPITLTEFVDPSGQYGGAAYHVSAPDAYTCCSMAFQNSTAGYALGNFEFVPSSNDCGVGYITNNPPANNQNDVQYYAGLGYSTPQRVVGNWPDGMYTNTVTNN